MSDADFRVPVPGGDALPAWRRSGAYSDLGLSPESIAALDQSEVEEQAMAARLRERTAANRAQIEAGNVLLNQRHAEQLRTDALTENELREELAAAIDKFNLAQRQVSDAELVLQRANTAVTEAQARMAQSSGLEDRIAAFHVDRIKSGSSNSLPPDLLEARREQRDAADALTQTQSAYVVLAGEFQEAQEAAEHAAQARDQAAVVVLSRHADHLASQIEQAQQHLHDLRQQALSISGLWLPLAGVATSLPVSDRVRAPLRRSDDRPLIDEDVKAQARAWFLLLQTDPHAGMGE